jgi:hypothetical protein
VWYNLNIKKLAVLLLPTFLRLRAHIFWLFSLVKPLEQIFDLWTNFRSENIYKLSHNSQICYLRKALNDRFDPELRRIEIADGNRYEHVYIFTDAEQQEPLWLWTDEEIADENISEAQPVYLYLDSDYSDTGVDFLVLVPAELLDENNFEMNALINYYKLASKRHKIVEK